MMKALITGASSGIGRELAKYLSKLGAELVLVARSKEKLEELQQELPTKTKIVIIDLVNEKQVKELYMILKKENIDILINNAGFGTFGDYESCDLQKELDMIDVNIKAVQVLTRMFLKDMTRRNSGYILNVSSSAGLLPGGPMMATYYATKSYITSFSLGIYEELRKKKSKVKISILCPGPVKTNFNKVANVKFKDEGLEASYVAKYAIDKMFKDNKLIIIPGFKYKLGIFLSRFVSKKLLLKITYNFQKRKRR